MKLIKTLLKKLILKDFIDYIYFIFKCTLAYRKTLKYQLRFDKLNPKSPNKNAYEISNQINKNDKKWAGFIAQVKRDKHGKNNTGINLNFSKKIGNSIVNMEIDPLRKGLGIDFKIGV